MKYFEEIKKKIRSFLDRTDHPDLDWPDYHIVLVKFLESEGIVFTEHFNEDISNHYLNAKKVSDFTLEELLISYTVNFSDWNYLEC